MKVLKTIKNFFDGLLFSKEHIEYEIMKRFLNGK